MQRLSPRWVNRLNCCTESTRICINTQAGNYLMSYYFSSSSLWLSCCQVASCTCTNTQNDFCVFVHNYFFNLPLLRLGLAVPGWPRLLCAFTNKHTPKKFSAHSSPPPRSSCSQVASCANSLHIMGENADVSQRMVQGWVGEHLCLKSGRLACSAPLLDFHCPAQLSVNSASSSGVCTAFSLLTCRPFPCLADLFVSPSATSKSTTGEAIVKRKVTIMCDT